jgi:glycosyltransferase involved in cell wall biosynthesis
LIIIGRPENREYADSLKKQVARMGLNNVVEFVNELPQAELAQRMARGCVFVLPSLSEGLGRVVVEAMAVGTPVIGSKVGGIPEMIEDGQNGFLVPPGDEEALTERLRWVLAHPEEAEKMAERARAFAQKFFSATSYLEGYRRLFEEARKICDGGKRMADAPVPL